MTRKGRNTVPAAGRASQLKQVVVGSLVFFQRVLNHTRLRPRAYDQHGGVGVAVLEGDGATGALGAGGTLAGDELKGVVAVDLLYKSAHTCTQRHS